MRSRVERVVLGVRYALATALVVVLAACGGDTTTSGIPPEEFASSFCSSVGLWRDRLADGSQVLAERLNEAVTLEEAKVEFLRFFDGAIRETDVMLAQVKAIEAPAVDSGEEITTELVAALGRFKPILVEARAKVNALPVEDELEFTTGAQQLGATYQSEVSQLGSTVAASVEMFDAPELAAAVEADADCQRL